MFSVLARTRTGVLVLRGAGPVGDFFAGYNATTFVATLVVGGLAGLETRDRAFAEGAISSLSISGTKVVSALDVLVIMEEITPPSVDGFEPDGWWISSTSAGEGTIPTLV